MRSYTKIKNIILVVLGLGFVLAPTIAYFVTLEIGYSAKNLEYKDNMFLDEESLRISKVSGKIHIDNNWTSAKSVLICTGNGTYSEPYVIEDLVIDAGGSGSCIWIENSDVYFRIENCTLSNSAWTYPYAGIRLINVDNGVLIDNNCTSNNYGIFVEASNNNTFIGNNVSDNRYYGIYLRGSSNYNRITENTVNNNIRYGIFLQCDYNIVKNNTINYNYRGVYFDYCDNNTIIGNTLKNNDYEGIYFYQGGDNNVTGNTVNNNGGDGIYISYSDNITVIGNQINNNDGDGIRFYSTDNSNVMGNVINNNTGAGIHFYYYYYYYESSYNVVIGNNISNNYGGIYLSGVNHTLLGNRMVGCGLVIYGYLEDLRSHIINSSNLVNDKPLYYYIDKDNLGPDNFTNAGQIFLVTCDNSLIFNFTFSNCSTGISLYYSNNNSISENIASNNSDHGIYLEYSHYNNITGNTANNNSYGFYLQSSNGNALSGNTANSNRYGLYLQSSYGNALSGNRANNNTEHGITLNNVYSWYYESNTITENEVSHNRDGIYLSYSQNVIITGNNVSNNLNGVYLTSSSKNNDVSENNISFNLYYGIRIGWDCDSNTIVRNNIMNNDIGIYIYYCKCNTISGNIFSGNRVDILGTQEECNPLPFLTLVIIVAFIVTIVVIAAVVTGVIAKKRIEIKKSRLPKDEVARYKVLKERERYKTPVRDESIVEMKSLPPNMSRCPYCGTPMNDDWVFCKKCGSRSEKKMG